MSECPQLRIVGVFCASLQPSLSCAGKDPYDTVSWETASEIDTQGFNLHRATSEDMTAAQLNAGLIEPQALCTMFGAIYGVTDADVSAGATYYYWLEDVDASSVRTMHGPVSAALIVHEATASPGPTPAAVSQPVRERPVRALPTGRAGLAELP